VRSRSSSQSTGYSAGGPFARPASTPFGERNAGRFGGEAGGAHCSVLRVRALEHEPPSRSLRAGGARSCLDLENSIASASIYKSSYEGLTVDALAPGADEGRVRLRKAPGSRQQGFDPEVSEWGNPAGVMPGHPGLNT
jgi:hypothetical protein